MVVNNQCGSDVEKVCQNCQQQKPLGEFFTCPKGAAVSWAGTGVFCKECHAAGLIPHGYGSYGDRYTSPDWIS